MLKTSGRICHGGDSVIPATETSAWLGRICHGGGRLLHTGGCSVMHVQILPPAVMTRGRLCNVTPAQGRNLVAHRTTEYSA